jgi:hypothetical protein
VGPRRTKRFPCQVRQQCRQKSAASQNEIASPPRDTRPTYCLRPISPGIRSDNRSVEHGNFFLRTGSTRDVRKTIN